MDREKAERVSDAVEGALVPMVLTDPNVDDNPITFVNDAFERVTLYRRDDVIGRNCRFLQGEKTEPEKVEEIREGLESGDPFQVTITNHKADGTPFRNHLMISPVTGEDGELCAYFAIQRELAAHDEAALRNDEALKLLRELQHRVKNHLSMVVSMIRLQARRPVTRGSFRAVGRRVEALALLYDEMFKATDDTVSGERIRTGAYLSRIVSVVSNISDQHAIRVNVHCDEVHLPVDQSARLGLLLSELLTNALEHAFEGRDTGTIDIRFEKREDGGVRLTVEDDGIGLPEGSNWPHEAMSVERQQARARNECGELDTTGHDGHSGVGGSIVVGLTQMLAATLDVTRLPHGTRVTVDFQPAP